MDTHKPSDSGFHLLLGQGSAPNACVVVGLLDDSSRALDDGGRRVSAAAVLAPSCTGVPSIQVKDSLTEGPGQAVAVIPLIEANAIDLLGDLHDAYEVGRLPDRPGPPQFPIKLAEQPAQLVFIPLQHHTGK